MAASTDKGRTPGYCRGVGSLGAPSEGTDFDTVFEAGETVFRSAGKARKQGGLKSIEAGCSPDAVGFGQKYGVRNMPASADKGRASECCGGVGSRGALSAGTGLGLFAVNCGYLRVKKLFPGSTDGHVRESPDIAHERADKAVRAPLAAASPRSAAAPSRPISQGS